jgi:hypothetical protein
MAYRDPRVDDVIARELYFYISNNGQLYRQQTRPIALALARRKVNKSYDPTLAVKAYENLVETGIKMYSREHGKITANPATRNKAAKLLFDEYREEVNETADQMYVLKKAGKAWTLRG